MNVIEGGSLITAQSGICFIPHLEGLSKQLLTNLGEGNKNNLSILLILHLQNSIYM